MNEPAVTPEVIEKHGITPEEYERIKGILGREPNFTELGVFSVMWSEHCSYKNSRPELKKFPVTGPKVLVKAGEENAGVIDIGDGWAVAFKMESHNHPSAVEPFQGAATGVGGIIRDIFTMGARPVFSMNSLRFGPIVGDGPEQRTNRRLFEGVVAGIAHYGNCIGIPTIGGEIYFDESYSGNPLVNVFNLGILRHEEIARGAASGIGNPVFYVGAETGRDGLAGAAFASRELTEESKEDRPAVQVGDPFREKLLLEACLELLASGCVAGIQDMGAAGLTCSTCETASRGGTGVEIDLQLVPKREDGMTPYETLLSESQERMLVIVKKGEEQTVRAIFEKWDLPYAEIGSVRDDGMMRVRDGEKTVVEIPARQLAEDAPIYHREVSEKPNRPPVDLAALPGIDLHKALPTLLADPSITSKNWVWRQYDHMVRLGATVLPGSDAAVFIVREANKILAASTDCNAIYCRQDPRLGAQIALAEACRNLACSGATPIAVTDNLNFGNPHKPENFLQLREAVEGLSDACRAFDIPVTGGNVSLYNENPEGAIDPTPTVGVVGTIDDPAHITTQDFKQAGDIIFEIGNFETTLGASHFLKTLYGRKEGLPPSLNLEFEIRLHAVLRSAIRAGLIASAHDCAEGGLAVALAESCLSADSEFGATISLSVAAGNNPDQLRHDMLLFGEAQSRIIISARPENAAALEAYLNEQGISNRRIGEVTQSANLSITLPDGVNYTWQCQSDLRTPWSDTIAEVMVTG
ncbi:MAG: phosphoribosylformylglycinamidine synthase subunit PurL [Chthoniobacterales bacterium]